MKNNGSEEKQNTEKKEVGIKIQVKVGVEEKKEQSQEEKAAEERRRLAESYRKHKIESHPPEEFWVPVRKCFNTLPNVRTRVSSKLFV